LLPEDNAKWLNIVAGLVSGRPVGTEGVGGITVSYLAIASNVFQALGPLFGLTINQLSTVVSTVVVAYLLLIVISPLAIPRKRKGVETFRIEDLLPVLLTSIFLVSCLVQVMRFGHLTAALFMIFGTTALGNVVETTGDDSHRRFFSLEQGILLLGLCSIWLPFHLLAGPVSIALGISFLIEGSGSPIFSKNSWFLSLIFVIAVLGSLTTSLLASRYLAQQDHQIHNLLSAGGGTPTYSSEVIFLFFITTSAFVLLTRTNRLLLALASILLAVSLTISQIDLFTTGAMNYGSQKLLFLIISVSISALMVPTLHSLFETLNVRDHRLKPVVLCLSLALLLTQSGSLTLWSQLGNETTWIPQNSEDDANWRSILEIRSSGVQPLDEIPLTCGVENLEVMYNLDYNTYLCTRLLLSVSGLADEGSALIEWHLRGDSQRSVTSLVNLPLDVRRRNILVLNPDGSIKRVEAIEDYLDKVQAFSN
jgi:hypothetical protein